MRTYIFRILLVSAACLIAACTTQPQQMAPPPPTEGEVVVYVTVPLSGFMANGGQTVLGGVRLAADEINRAGGLLGRQVVVEAVDDEADSDLAAQIAQNVAAAASGSPPVLGVVGHLNSGQTEAALPIYDGADVVVVTPTSSLESLTEQSYRRFFRVLASDRVQAEVDARFLLEELGGQQIAVIHNDESYGIDLAAEIARQIEAMGGTVAVQRQIPIGPPGIVGEPDAGEPVYYPEVVEEIAASGADAIFYAGYEIECPYLRYDLREAGMEALPFLASDGCFLADTIDQADGAAEGMYVSAFGPSPTVETVGEAWFTAYQAVEYRDPGTYSVNGYVAMRVLAEGARKAGTLEANAVSDAIRELEMDTLIGPVQYQDDGNLQDPKIYIYRVEGDTFEQVYSS